ncbi:hypothetical protein FACS189443_4110 [Planctomycetales bacterium]|nr:hypothetical protein FACS189443_4110 [Planctomycetales bacterium]
MTFLQPNTVQCSGNHIELFDRFGVLAFERQCDLQELIQGEDWNLDINKGEITFGKKIRAEIQLIGSFAQSNKSWLWSWANEESDVPQSRLLQSLRLKEIGESNGIPQFTTPCFDTEKIVGHLFAMIASGLFGASGYYPAGFGNGHVFATISSPQIDEFSSSRNHVIPSIFSQFISITSSNRVMKRLSF